MNFLVQTRQSVSFVTGPISVPGHSGSEHLPVKIRYQLHISEAEAPMLVLLLNRHSVQRQVAPDALLADSVRIAAASFRGRIPRSRDLVVEFDAYRKEWQDYIQQRICREWGLTLKVELDIGEAFVPVIRHKSSHLTVQVSGYDRRVSFELTVELPVFPDLEVRARTFAGRTKDLCVEIENAVQSWIQNNCSITDIFLQGSRERVKEDLRGVLAPLAETGGRCISQLAMVFYWPFRAPNPDTVIEFDDDCEVADLGRIRISHKVRLILRDLPRCLKFLQQPQMCTVENWMARSIREVTNQVLSCSSTHAVKQFVSRSSEMDAESSLISAEDSVEDQIRNQICREASEIGLGVQQYSAVAAPAFRQVLQPRHDPGKKP